MVWIVLAAILWALWRTRKSLALAAYFFAQLAYVPATRYVAWRYGDTSNYYVWTYGLFTGLILLAALNLALRLIFRRRHPWRAIACALVLAITLAHIAFSGLDHPAAYYDYIGISEGVTLAFAGVLLGGVSFWTEKPLLFLCLGLLWLGQCWFRLGFYMHITEQQWLRANWTVPAWLCIGGFALVGALAGLTRAHLRAERRMRNHV